MEMSLSSLVSSQEFPVLANLSVLLNFLALASLIRLHTVIFQRLKRYLHMGVIPLPKAELFFPPILFDLTLSESPSWNECYPGYVAPQCLIVGHVLLEEDCSIWAVVISEEYGCKDILTRLSSDFSLKLRICQVWERLDGDRCGCTQAISYIFTPNFPLGFIPDLSDC